MLRTLIIKEINALLLSPKFSLTLVVCSMLLLLSVYTGIIEYKQTMSQYEAAQQIESLNFQEAKSAHSASALVHRKPNPIQILFSGIHFDLGRITSVSKWSDPNLIRSMYSETPVFALFRMLDFGFIFQVILTLFALLFTYDSISGERESGTLRLVFSNSVPRSTYLAAKIIGNGIGLIAPLMIPILLSLLIIQFNSISLSDGDWITILLTIISGILLLFVFLLLGLSVSAMSQQSNTAFLILLSIWILTVLLIPKAGALVADSIIKTPSDSELTSMKGLYAEEKMRAHNKELASIFRNRDLETEGMTNEQVKAYRDEKEWEWMEEDDTRRQEMQKDINAYGDKLYEEFQNKKIQKEQLAYRFAKISPVATFQFIGNTLAQTDVALKNRYQTSLNEYKTTYTSYVDEKQKASGSPGGLRITIDDEEGFKIDFGRGDARIDFSDRPIFDHPAKSSAQLIQETLSDMLSIVGFGVVLFGISFWGFLNYKM